MMGKKDEEIQRKLEELENTILKEQTLKKELPAKSESPKLVISTESGISAETAKSDLHYFGGIASIAVGLIILFQTVKVQTSFMNILGMGSFGFGLLLLPLLIGFGWLLYDSKSRAAWLLTGASCALIVLYILGSLVMYIPTLPLLSMVMILFPLALGGALLVKGAGGPKGVVQEIKKLKS